MNTRSLDRSDRVNCQARRKPFYQPFFPQTTSFALFKMARGCGEEDMSAAALRASVTEGRVVLHSQARLSLWNGVFGLTQMDIWQIWSFEWAFKL